MMHFFKFLAIWFVTLGLSAAEASTFQYMGSTAQIGCSNVALFGVPQYTCVRNFYMNATTGSDSYDGTSPTVGGGHGPWATLAHADVGATNPGDCVNLAAGVYSFSNVINMRGPTTAGVNTPTGYVTYRGPTPGVRPSTPGSASNAIIRAASGGNLGSGVAVPINLAPNSGSQQGANYIIFDGIEFDGNSNTAVTEAFGMYPPGQHHVVWENNIVHGWGGGGIGAAFGEYYWIVNNYIYGNGATQMIYEGSGISILGPSAPTYRYPGWTPNATDMALPWHIVVAGNIVASNTVGPTGCAYGVTQTPNTFTATGETSNTITFASLPAWVNTTNGNFAVQDTTNTNAIPFITTITNVTGSTITLSRNQSGVANGDNIQIACGTNWGTTHTDENGIILDTWTQNSYSGPALYAFNEAYNNGGAGIHVLSTNGSPNGITIANNSLYGNFQDAQNTTSGVDRGDLNCVACSNITFINNASQSVVGGSLPTSTNQSAYMDSLSSHNTYTTNIGTPSPNSNVTGSSGSGNVWGTSPLFNSPSTFDFSLKPGSSARGLATSESWLQSTPMNAGAWQFLNCTIQ